MTDTERDALANLIHDQWQDGRDGYEAADAVRAWMRENCYEKREPVAVHDAMVDRGARALAWAAEGRTLDECRMGERDGYRREARAVLLAALTPDGQEKTQ